MKIEEVKSMKRDSERIESFFKDFEDETKDQSCDKYGAEFNYDDRFSCFGNHNVFFSAWTGYYGNSGCSTFRSIQNERLFWKFFDEYLNSNKEEIFKYIARRFMVEVEENKSIIKEEIESLQKFLEQIK